MDINDFGVIVGGNHFGNTTNFVGSFLFDIKTLTPLAGEPLPDVDYSAIAIPHHESFIDMINGTKKSSWAQALNIQYPYFGSRFAATIMPEIIGAVGINPAYALQAWAAITGYLIPAQEYNGRPLANDLSHIPATPVW